MIKSENINERYSYYLRIIWIQCFSDLQHLFDHICVEQSLQCIDCQYTTTSYFNYEDVNERNIYNVNTHSIYVSVNIFN